MFGQTAIAGHQLIHFDAGLLKYKGLIQILSKVQMAALINDEKI